MAVSNMNLIRRALMSQLRETQALACGGGGGRRPAADAADAAAASRPKP